jgi:hypothetical protein
MDQQARLKDAYEDGELVGRVQLAQRLLQMTVATREELVGLGFAELRNLAESLERQLASRVSPPTVPAE